jgi:epoxide hydrolase-like predicted phosphatase
MLGCAAWNDIIQLKGTSFMAIRAVIFDVGGVLVRDSEPAPRHRAWERRLGIERGMLGAAIYGTSVGDRAMVGKATMQEMWQDVARRYGLSDTERDQLAEDFFLDNEWNVELLEFARSLRPQFKTGVISDAWLESRQAIRDYVNDRVFDVIVYSAEEGICKPDPEIYRRALERLGVAPQEATFVDDRIKNVEGARRLGIHAFQYTDTAAARQEIERLIREVTS